MSTQSNQEAYTSELKLSSCRMGTLDDLDIKSFTHDTDEIRIEKYNHKKILSLFTPALNKILLESLCVVSWSPGFVLTLKWRRKH